MRGMELGPGALGPGRFGYESPVIEGVLAIRKEH
jgi:hypothetical protein